MTNTGLTITNATNGGIIVDGITAVNTANINGTTTLTATNGTTGFISFINANSTFSNALSMTSDNAVTIADGV